MSNQDIPNTFTSSSEYAYKTIKYLINNSIFLPGQRLVLSDLSDRFNMSKTPLLTALKRLESEGFVSYKKNYGYSIKDIPHGRNNTDDVQTKEERSSSDLVTSDYKAYSNVGATTSLKEIAYEELRKLILSNRFARGQKLSYSDLVNLLHMSKTPIISALNRLENEGYVIQKRNAGYYIKNTNREEILQFLKARRAMEVSNIDLVIENYHPNDLKRLESIHKKFIKDAPDQYNRKRILLNREFHLELAKIGRNSFLVKYITQLNNWADIGIWSYVLPRERIKGAVQEHEKVIDALRAMNKTKLKRVLNNHMSKTIQFVEKQSIKSDYFSM